MVKIVCGIDIQPLLDAFASFEEAMGQVTSDLTRDGTIQRFEYTFELAWKTMKRVLRAKGSEVNQPRDVFREAAADQLIADPASLAQKPHIDYVREAGSEGIELVMWLIARGAMSDVNEGKHSPKVAHRFYHVPASNTAVGHLILENA